MCLMAFEEWWQEWNKTMWDAGGLASPKQVKLIFKDCYLEGYEKGAEDERKKLTNEQ